MFTLAMRAYVLEDEDRLQFETDEEVDKTERTYAATYRAGLTAFTRASADERFAATMRAIDLATAEGFRIRYTEYVMLVVPHFAQDAYEALDQLSGLDHEAAHAATRQDEQTWLDIGARWLRDHLPTSVGNIARATKRLFAQEITHGVDEGLSVAQIARNIRRRVGVISRARATRWVRTESGALSNYGARAGAQAAGGDRKIWLATPDDRTRTTHAGAHKQVVGITKKFRVGSEVCDYPGDPTLPAGERINCRCAQAFLLADEDEDEALDAIVDIENDDGD